MRRWGNLQRKQFNQEIEYFSRTISESKYRIYPRYLGRIVGREPDRGPLDRAVVLASYPPARTNKYQYLLYKESVSHGFHILPMSDPKDLEFVPWPGDLVLHIHWTSDVLKRAENEEEALDLCSDFIEYLEQLKSERGVKLIWTAHNLLPHNSRFRDVEKLFRQRLIDVVDGIHLLTEASREVLQGTFTIDEEKTFVCQHPSYVSAYADFSSMKDARIELGIDQDRKVLLLFGSVSEYKGIDFLIENFDQLASESSPPLHLLIAGAPSNEDVGMRVESYASSRTNVTADLRKIPDDQMHFFFNAADVVLTPYVEGLNSGVQLLGLTFNKPVLSPSDSNLAELDSPLFHTYGSNNLDSFQQGVMRALEQVPSDGELLRHEQFIQSLDPTRLSAEFFERLSDLLFR